jgi:hypothetical protein
VLPDVALVLRTFHIMSLPLVLLLITVEFQLVKVGWEVGVLVCASIGYEL